MATELMSALEQLNAEVGIPLDDLVRTVEVALAEAYVRAFEPEGSVRVELDRASGAIRVTSRLRTPDGTETEVELPVDEFRRLAAQTARGARGWIFIRPL